LQDGLFYPFRRHVRPQILMYLLYIVVLRAGIPRTELKNSHLATVPLLTRRIVILGIVCE